MAKPQATLAFAAWIGLASAVAVSSGCTHLQLARNTALTATTVTTIQYRMVLDNLAAISCQPGTLPAHVRLKDGTVQMSNETGFGNSGGFTTFGGDTFGIDAIGPNVRVKVSEQWGTDAVADPIQVYELQSLYRLALGLPPLPEPNFIASARRAMAESSDGESGEDSSDEDDGQEKPLATQDFDIPTGWFGLGSKRDVPDNACYVGRYGDRYAWVTPDGVGDLAHFTLAVATITKSGVKVEGAPSSLMVTP